jgi:hypothetical protein
MQLSTYKNIVPQLTSHFYNAITFIDNASQLVD